MAKKRRSSERSSGGQQFDLDRYLKKTKSKWEEAAERAKENKGGFAEYDDGRYILKLLKAEAGISGSKRPQVIQTWKFMDGDYKGKTYKSYRGIQDADNMYYFLLDAKRLGYEIDDFDTDDMKNLLKQMTKDKPVVAASLRSKGEFQNVLINKVLDEDELEDDEDEDEDDDEPKKKKKSKKSKDEDDEDEEDGDEDESDEDEDDEDEKPKRKKKKSKKDDDDEEEEEDEDDEDEDEEEEKPRRKKKRSKSEDDDEDEEEDDEDEDDEPKKKKKKRKSDDDEEEDEDEDDGEEVAVTVGSIVKVKLKAGTTKAEIVEVMEEDNAVKVKTKDGKTVRVSADKILSVEAPPKKRKK